MDGGIWEVSNPGLFDLNRAVHESIISCSRNVFFIAGKAGSRDQSQAASYRAIVSSSVGTRGLLAGVPEASAWRAISGMRCR